MKAMTDDLKVTRFKVAASRGKKPLNILRQCGASSAVIEACRQALEASDSLDLPGDTLSLAATGYDLLVAKRPDIFA